MKDEAKLDRLRDFGAAMGRVRARVRRDLARGSKHHDAQTATSRRAVIAAVIRLLDRYCLRVGNETYAILNGSSGATTLRARHARLSGPVLMLQFRGKGDEPVEATVDDARPEPAPFGAALKRNGVKARKATAHKGVKTGM